MGLYSNWCNKWHCELLDKMKVRCGCSLSHALRMFSEFREDADHLAIEGGDVFKSASCNQIGIADYIARAIFEASRLFDYNRLPECFSGHPRDDEHPFPALYPKANSPQAWSAASVFAIVQAMLGLYPFAPTNLLLLDPHLPECLPEMFVRNLHVGRAVVSIRFYRKGQKTDFEVLDKRGALHVLRQPSPWSLTAGLGERIKDVMESLIP